MKKELDEALCKDFPNLYRKRHGNMMETAMMWGFECGSGWHSIIRNLSKEVEAEILKLPEESRQYCCASQVKEKYGTLRFYMHSQTDEMDWLISEAEHKSSITCELCGKKGSIRADGWITVRCDDCYLESYLSRCVDGIVHEVKQVEYERYDGKKALKNTIDNKQENIKGMVIDLKEIFHPEDEKEKMTLTDIKDSIIRFIDWKLYKITSTIKHPIWFFQDLKRSIKYRIWKIRRLLRVRV